MISWKRRDLHSKIESHITMVEAIELANNDLSLAVRCIELNLIRLSDQMIEKMANKLFNDNKITMHIWENIIRLRDQKEYKVIIKFFIEQNIIKIK